MALYGIVCSVCHRHGIAPVDLTGVWADPYVSRHGWALCTLHADNVDPRYPDDPRPIPFVPDDVESGNVRTMRGRRQ